MATILNKINLNGTSYDIQDSRVDDLSLDTSGLEETANKTTTLSSTSTDTEYPSAKATVSYVDSQTTSTKEYVDSQISSAVGDISTVLDTINGEEI